MSVGRNFIQLFFLVITLLFLFITTASAGSCKGLSKSVCRDSSSCKWVEAQKTKKGKEIDSFCSKKSGNSDKEKRKNSRKEKYDEQGANEKLKMQSQKSLKEQGRSLPQDY